MDLFFVISGFVIAYVYSGKINSLRDFGGFIQRRVGRLLPLHWITLSLSVIIYWALSKAGFAPKHMPYFSIECIGSTAFLMHGLVDCGGLYFNGQSWSISAEMAMYIIFPLLLFFVRRPVFPLLVGFFAILTFVLFDAAQDFWVGRSFSWDATPPVIRALPSFLFGVVLFNNKDALKAIPMPSLLLLLTSSLLFFCMVSGVPMLLSLLLVYLTATFSVSADVQLKSTKIVRLLSPLGQLTYSIYMWHGMLIMLIINGVGDKFLRGAHAPMIALSVLCYLAIFIISYCSYFYIETPARRWIDRVKIF